MRYLLDTHTLLWFLQDAPELPGNVADRIEADSAECLVSMASVWEMGIKISLGRLRVPYSLHPDLPRILQDSGMELKPIRCDHVQRVALLPFHHRDPFDRLLAAQALQDDLVLLGRDEAFDAYDVRRVWG